MIGWSYYTIPTLVFLTNTVMFLSMGARFDPRDLAFYFIVVNAYMFGVASMSKVKEKYLVVFLPWVFLPVSTQFFSVTLGNFGVAFTILFVTSLLMEYMYFNDISFSIFILRSFTMIVIFWELKKWLRSSLISYIAR